MAWIEGSSFFVFLRVFALLIVSKVVDMIIGVSDLARKPIFYIR